MVISSLNFNNPLFIVKISVVSFNVTLSMYVTLIPVFVFKANLKNIFPLNSEIINSHQHSRSFFLNLYENIRKIE